MTRLFLRKLKSVGFVDAGACEGADIVLAKRRDDADLDAAIEQLSKAGRKMAGPRLTRLREVVSQLSALLSEVDDESPADDSGKDTSMKFDASTLPQEAQEYIAGIEKAAAERAADLEAQLIAAKSEPAPAEEDALKALPAEIRKRLEDAEKAAAEAQSAAKAERDARVTAEFIAKCAFVEGKLPIKAADLGPIMKRLTDAEQTEADVAEIERVLKAAAEASKVTAIIGEDGKPEGSAVDSIEKAATEIRKNNPTLSLAAARVEARKLNPDLARAEKAERRAA